MRNSIFVTLDNVVQGLFAAGVLVALAFPFYTAALNKKDAAIAAAFAVAAEQNQEARKIDDERNALAKKAAALEYRVSIAETEAKHQEARVAELLAKQPKPITVSDIDPGGNIGQYVMWWERVRDSGAQVMVDGECISACTLLMGIIPPERVCMTDRASFGIHQAATGDVDKAGNPVGDPELTKRVQRLFYPKIVKDWIAAWEKEHGPLTLDVIYMMPEDMKGYYKMCENQPKDTNEKDPASRFLDLIERHTGAR